MMAVDNMMRSLNKIHMSLPLLLIGIPLGAVCMAPILYPMQFFPYIVHIIVRCLFHTNQHKLMQEIIYLMRVVTALAVVGILVYRSKSVTTMWCKKMIQMQMMHETSTTTTATTIKTSLFSAPARIRVDVFRFILMHIAWVGVCYYIEVNADMANKILLAPWQQSINLDDIL